METQKQNKKKCTSCETYAKKHWYLIVISLYTAFATIYGSIEIFKNVYAYFTR